MGGINFALCSPQHTLILTPHTASAVIGMFYEELQEMFDGLPLPIAYGHPNRGKSKAAKLAVAACGNPKVIYTQ